MKNTTPIETVGALKRYMENTPGVTQSRIAKAIGVSDTIVSQFLAGKYSGDVEKIRQRVDEFLEREQEREIHASLKPAFAMTSQAADAIAVINYCHVHRMIGVIHAPAGLGKTMSLRQYASEKSWVKVITCHAGMNQRDLLEEILDEFGVTPRGSCARMLRTAVEELEGSEIIVIFDEAQHLKLAGFEAIRALHDRTEVPVIFAGTDDIIDRMTGKKNIVYDQIFSRVGIKRKLKTSIRKTDVGLIVEKAGVETRRDLLDFLYEVARRKGYYRTMTHCLYTAMTMARQRMEELTVGHLHVASQFLWDSAA